MPKFELPEGWVETTIGSVCELNPKDKVEDNINVGFMPMQGMPTDFHGKLEYENRPWHEVKKGYTQFRDGDTLFAKITPCFENSKAAIVSGFPNGIGAGSTEYYVLRPIFNGIHPKILLALVKTKAFLTQGALNMSGSVGHKRVPKTFVEDYPLPLPPLAEQREVAARLDGLLAQVDSIKGRLDGVPALLKRFRQTVLAAAVSGRLTEEWRNKHGKSHNWVNTKLGPYLDDLRYGTSKKCNYEDTEGTPVLRIPNISNSRINDADLKFSHLDDKERNSFALQEGDLLLIRSNGSLELVGKTAIVDKSHVGFTFAGYLIRLRVKMDVLSPQFLQYNLAAPNARAFIEETARSTSGVNNINSDEIKSIRINLPPLEEQTEIVRRVETLFTFADQLEARVKAAQAQVNQLTQAILAKAFRGELTADWRAQHPELSSGEHSAAALLQRIQAERAQSSTAGKGAKGRGKKSAAATRASAHGDNTESHSSANARTVAHQASLFEMAK